MVLLLLLLLETALFPGKAKADVFYTREEALRLAFPEAERVENKTFSLKEDEVKQVEELARSQIASRSVTFYAGIKDGKILGYAFIDTATVRTLPGTFLIVLSPDGRVRSIHILAFYEPSEYLPPKRWLKQFEQKELGSGLKLHQEIHGIAGSTLSAQAVTASVRRALVLYQRLLKGEE